MIFLKRFNTSYVEVHQIQGGNMDNLIVGFNTSYVEVHHAIN